MNKEVKMEEQILDKYKKDFYKKLNYLEKHKEIEEEGKNWELNTWLRKLLYPENQLVNELSHSGEK